MKTTFKLTAALALASGLIASQAFAGDTLGQQRLADRNAEYFKQAGTQTSSNWTPPAQTYDASNPHQRMGQRSAEYFAGKPGAQDDSQPVREIKPARVNKR